MGGVKPDWLAQLSPPHAPAPAGWWPLAPGWWALALLTVLAVVAVLLWWRSPRLRMRRAALRELAQLESAASDDGELARGLEHLVRRYAVARFGRDAVAGLSGARWIAFVAAHGGSDWSGDAGSALLQAAYGGSFQSGRASWLAGARAFFKTRT